MAHETSQLEELLEFYYSKGPISSRMDEITRGFRADGYIEIEDLVPLNVLRAIREDVSDLVSRAAIRRDIHIPITDNTPRYYSNVSRFAVDAHSKLIPAFYRSNSLRKLLCAITGEYLISVPYEPEHYVISRLHRKGDTHGWHWDDYAYALIMIIEATPKEAGGSVQFVPNTHWNRSDPKINDILGRHQVRERHPPSGCSYLMRTDTSLHRVTPLTADADRVIVCLSFANSADLRSQVSHETMELMYPEAAARIAATQNDKSA
jgi:hypothetical protein